MTFQEERLRHLLRQYADNHTSSEEITEMLDLLKQAESDKALENLIIQLRSEVREEKQDFAIDWEKMWEQIRKQQPEQGKMRSFFWRRIAVAASILLVVGLSSYFLFFNKSPKQDDEVVAETKDVKAPETNRAMITLADGRTVYLESAVNGELAQQGNIKLVKFDNGQIAYQTSGGDPDSYRDIKEIQYNTLSNPRGSKVIDMALSDGSHVWLNAGSSVTYPVAFVGNERKVAITGEAYFEVTHDASKPFVVNKGETSVQVMGTHFNVNAYDDENDIKVTLLEGSVKVSNGNNESLLKPGQQAQVSSPAGGGREGAVKVVNNVDLELVMAWKNGLFSFDNADLPTVMRQLSKWYDIEIAYAGKIPDGRFKGEIPRDLTLSQLLNGLTSTRIHFKIEGNKKIIILPE